MDFSVTMQIKGKTSTPQALFPFHESRIHVSVLLLRELERKRHFCARPSDYYDDSMAKM